MPNAVSILVIDTCLRSRASLDIHLSRRGYHVLHAADGLTGLTRLDHSAVDLVIVNIDLPDVDGYAFCRHLRDYRMVPIVALTSNPNETNIVRGLEAGADACLDKLISIDELLARTEAVLRRHRSVGAKHQKVFSRGAMTVDIVRRTVTVGGHDIVLSARECRLIYRLALNAGQVLGHAELLRWGWGPGYEGETGRLHAAVRRLRGKLEPNPGSPRYLVTRPGVGYVLALPTAGS